MEFTINNYTFYGLLAVLMTALFICYYREGRILVMIYKIVNRWRNR